MWWLSAFEMHFMRTLVLRWPAALFATAVWTTKTNDDGQQNLHNAEGSANNHRHLDF